jgi:hypothetical protein
MVSIAQKVIPRSGCLDDKQVIDPKSSRSTDVQHYLSSGFNDQLPIFTGKSISNIKLR